MKNNETSRTLNDWAQSRNDASPLLAMALERAKTLWIDAAHPLQTELVETLDLLGELGVDEETLAATIFHALNKAGIALTANETQPLADLLEGQQAAERIWTLYAAHGSVGNAEGLRRLLLAIIRDVRVVFILLARQLVRMRAAATAPQVERQALAQLSADIHAPLANRLGIWQIKWELEDLVFRYLQPDTYKRIARLLDERRGDRERYISAAIDHLQQALHKANIQTEVAGRPKHIYSIWRKMQRKDKEFSDLYDIRALRVLVNDVPSCYAALGIVHSLWPHISGEFDDYITRPKGNQYQSLHTAVMGPEGKTLEVQIRSRDMHEHAERGVAAHWRYKEGGGADSGFERKIAWMRQLLESRDEHDDETALLAGFRTDIIEDRVYVLTPKGEVVDLARGATVLDFAYHVHTEVGHRCRGAKVNGRIVPLSFQPTSGDRVEVITGKIIEPHRDWLATHHGYLNTARAREKVRAWFKRIDYAANLAAGRALLDRELKRLALTQTNLEVLLPKFQLKTQDDLFEALALGDVTPGQIARALHETDTPRVAPTPTPARAIKPGKDAVTIEGVGNLLTQLARCCQPLPGDAIAGFITLGRGVSVHRTDCAQLQHLRERDANRVLEIEWGSRRAQTYEVNVLVRGYDRKWLHKDVTNVIAATNAHLLAVNTQVDAKLGLAQMQFALRVTDFDQLSLLLNRVLAVPNVIEAQRLS